MLEYTPHFCWTTTIVEVKNPNHAAIKPGLVQCSYESERMTGTAIASGVAPQAKKGLYESPFTLFSANIPEVQALRQFCVQALGEVIFKLNAQVNQGKHPMEKLVIDPFESWVHITRDGGQHDVHVHPNCSWCGIYYIDIGDCTIEPPNGVNRFYPPVDLIYEDLGTVVFPLNPVHPTPEDGKLVLFPSYVRHSGTLYRGRRDRILASFNAKVQRPAM
jgi:uncharacterized protein (TIGR02466 family)